MTTDRFNRPLKDLRISVTDRCNYRCGYCMPNEVYEWIERKEILTFEEIDRVARVFAGLGVTKIRLTGGEPLLRKRIETLVEKLAVIPGVDDLALTTNGAALASKASALKSAGLRRLTVSLDTLDAVKFRRLTKYGDLGPVLEGIEAARRAGFHPIKINAVIQRGVNDDEIVDLVQFCRERGLTMRFIEYMDVGNANRWSSDQLVSKREIVTRIAERFPLRERGHGGQGFAPSVDYEFLDGSGEVGVIGSMTEPFCGTCTRARLTSDGKLVTCLFSQEGVDIKTPLRRGAPAEELTALISQVWANRRDRYSEERGLLSHQRKLEMITLGG